MRTENKLHYCYRRAEFAVAQRELQCVIFDVLVAAHIQRCHVSFTEVAENCLKLMVYISYLNQIA